MSGLLVLGVYLLIEKPRPNVSVRAIVYQTAFWGFFVVCMIVGISVTH